MSTLSGSIFNPGPNGIEHEFPQTVWFIPNASTTVTIQMTCKNNSGGNQVVDNLTIYLYDYTQAGDVYSFNSGSGIYSATRSGISSGYFNGSNVFIPGFSATSGVYEVDCTVTFTGTPYGGAGGSGGGTGNLYSCNGGVWTAQGISEYTGSAWETTTTLWYYTGSAWEQRA